MDAFFHFFHALGIRDIAQLVAATLVFLMLPGPGTLCILTSAGRGGRRGGFLALAGLMLGDALLMLAAALGVATLLQTHPPLFRAMQSLGALYLAWLGLRLLLAKGDTAAVAPFPGLADFRRGLLVTLLNPKAIVFYMAFFPLFIDPLVARGAVTFLAMGGVISTCTLCYGSLLVVAGGAAARRLRERRGIVRLATRLAGISLIGFGLRLTTR